LGVKYRSGFGSAQTFVSHQGNFPFLLFSHCTATFAKLSRKFLPAFLT
jgi:hypothetical protein